MNNVLQYFDYFKPKDNTAIHPDYKTLIQKVTKIKGRQLYQFKNLADMPHNRFTFYDRFSIEYNMRLDLEKSNEIDDAIIEKIENPTAKSILQVRDLVLTRKRFTESTLSLDMSYRLVSCAYFWKDENLDEYDFEIGDEKISLFKEVGLESFFLTKHIKDFLPLMNLYL